jgi:hypothetical protein
VKAGTASSNSTYCHQGPVQPDDFSSFQRNQDGDEMSLICNLNWFTGWRTEIASVKAKPKQKEKMLPSLKCLDDIESTIVVFLKLCEIHMSEFKGNGIYPSRWICCIAII